MPYTPVAITQSEQRIFLSHAKSEFKPFPGNID